MFNVVCVAIGALSPPSALLAIDAFQSRRCLLGTEWVSRKTSLGPGQKFGYRLRLSWLGLRRFTPELQAWSYRDLGSLTECGPQTLSEERQTGVVIIDSDGRRWVVRSVRRIGRAKPLLTWLWGFMVGGARWRLEQALESLAPLTLTEMRDFACASIQANWEYYCLDDEKEEVLEPLIQEVRAAQSVAQIFRLIDPDGIGAAADGAQA